MSQNQSAPRELPPCPFCGSEDARIATSWDHGFEHYWAFCSSCSTSNSHCWSTRQEAIVAWNRRAESASPETPEGWQLVPKVPTPGMLHGLLGLGMSGWDAALAAAPSPETPRTTDEAVSEHPNPPAGPLCPRPTSCWKHGCERHVDCPLAVIVPENSDGGPLPRMTWTDRGMLSDPSGAWTPYVVASIELGNASAPRTMAAQPAASTEWACPHCCGTGEAAAPVAQADALLDTKAAAALIRAARDVARASYPGGSLNRDQWEASRDEWEAELRDLARQLSDRAAIAAQADGEKS